jgi:hypothetical protein
MLLTVLIISTVSSRMMIPPVIMFLRPPRRMIRDGGIANVNVWPQFQRGRGMELCGPITPLLSPTRWRRHGWIVDRPHGPD